MRVLRAGLKGNDVGHWQTFLRGLGHELVVNDEFDDCTVRETEEFQIKHNLSVDGVAGNKTFGQAQLLGFVILDDDEDDSVYGPNWPTPPDFKPLSPSERETLFGKFKFKPAPSSGNPEGIQILDDWPKKNLTRVVIPQLKTVQYGPPGNVVVWHIKGADQLVNLFKAWDDAGLMNRVLTWAGSWNPRFVRGSRTTLSNHAWSTAIDLNAPWNGLGREGAKVGQKGSVRELIPIANQFGFYSGGHFKRKDFMHFELAKLL